MMWMRSAVGWVCLFGLLTMICGCSAGCGADETTTEKQVDDGRVSTPIGLSFVPPEQWEAVASPAAVSMQPPDYKEGAEEYLLVLRFAPDDLETPTQIGGEYLETLATEFEGKVPDAERVDPSVGLADELSIGGVAWDIQKADELKRVAFYMALDRPWMLVLRVSGPRDRVLSLTEPLTELFESVRLEESTIDPALVGTWQRESDGQTEGSAPSEMVLEKDGTLRVIYAESSMEGEDSGDLGRWAVHGEDFYQYVGSRRSGSVWMDSQAWNLKDDGHILEIGDGDAKKTWVRQ